MPTVILRGRKDGRAVSRLVLEGSSSNPIRLGLLNGEPFEVTDEEFAKLDARYVLESADGKSDDNDPPPEPEVDDGDDDYEDDEK